jgi:sialic acid synthase SpsE
MLANIITSASSDSCLPSKPYLIAEIGVNHECKIDLAKHLIDQAQEGGADAVKFQSYKAESLAVQNSPSYWDLDHEPTESQFLLFQKYDKFWKKEFELLFDYCSKVGIEFLSTPFDKQSALFLSDLVSTFKISSSDLTNKPFIDYLCSFRKPILLSTGASYLWEVQRTVQWVADHNVDIALMHCMLSYPTCDNNANLSVIRSLQKCFPNICVGYSDHTLPGDMTPLLIAHLLGARILEKHFTFDKTLPGNDHYHSMDLHDLKAFQTKLDRHMSLLGSSNRIPFPCEEGSRANARRSLVTSMAIQPGQEILESHLTYKRPGTGIEPSLLESVLGRKAHTYIPEDTILTWSLFDG